MINSLDQYLTALKRDASNAATIREVAVDSFNQAALQTLLQLIDQSSNSELYACLLLLVLGDMYGGNVKNISPVTKILSATHSHVGPVGPSNMDRQKFIVSLQNKIDMQSLVKHAHFGRLCRHYYLLMRSQQASNSSITHNVSRYIKIAAGIALLITAIAQFKPNCLLVSKRITRTLFVILLISSYFMTPQLIFKARFFLTPALLKYRFTGKKSQSLINYFLRSGYNQPLQYALDQVYKDSNAIALHVTQKCMVLQKIQKTIILKNR